MAQIKRLSDNEIITVSEYPTRIGNMWMCGDQSFSDPTQTLYQPIGYPSQFVNGGHFYSLFTNQQQQDIENSNDPIVKQFLLNVNKIIAASAAGAAIDLGATATQEGLGYLASTNVNPAPQTPRTYIQASDIVRISTNVLP